MHVYIFCIVFFNPSPYSSSSWLLFVPFPNWNESRSRSCEIPTNGVAALDADAGSTLLVPSSFICFDIVGSVLTPAWLPRARTMKALPVSCCFC